MAVIRVPAGLLSGLDAMAMSALDRIGQRRRLAPARDAGDIARARKKRGAKSRSIAPTLGGNDDEARRRGRLRVEIEAFDPPLNVDKALLLRCRRRHGNGKPDAPSQ